MAVQKNTSAARTSAARTAAKAPAKAAPAKAAPKKAPATPIEEAPNAAKIAAGYKARETYSASSVSGETAICVNKEFCKVKGAQPIFHFPTTSMRKDGTLGRGKECRKCRDGRRAASKA
jgi:hypothetical protein